jgi:hypothetical protein
LLKQVQGSQIVETGKRIASALFLDSCPEHSCSQLTNAMLSCSKPTFLLAGLRVDEAKHITATGILMNISTVSNMLKQAM